MEIFNRDKTWEPIDFTVYFSFVKWPFLTGLVLEIILRLLANRPGAGFWFDRQEILVWILRILVFVFIGWKTLRSFGKHMIISAISGAVAGGAIGIIIALLRFLGGIRIWKFFNLVTETPLAALVGAVVVSLAVYILSFSNK